MRDTKDFDYMFILNRIREHFRKHTLLPEAKDWPKCYIHHTTMYQVIHKGEKYYECYEITDELVACRHKEWAT